MAQKPIGLRPISPSVVESLSLSEGPKLDIGGMQKNIFSMSMNFLVTSKNEVTSHCQRLK